MRCPGGASGHETDKVSASSPANARPLAKGLNPDDGGAEIVCFDTPSGGHVFSVGSIAWRSCLSYNDYENTVSRVTENVVRRFASPEPLADPSANPGTWMHEGWSGPSLLKE